MNRQSTSDLFKIAQHDIKLVQRGLSRSFTRLQDKLLLLLAAPFLIAWLWHGLREFSNLLAQWGSLSVSFLTFSLVVISIVSTTTRFDWHRKNGVLAAIALRRDVLYFYISFLIAISFLFILILVQPSFRSGIDIAIGLIFGILEVVIAGYLFPPILRTIRLLFARLRLLRGVSLESTPTARARDVVARIVALPMIGFRANMIAGALLGAALAMVFETLRWNGAGPPTAGAIAGIGIVGTLLVLAFRLPHSVPQFFNRVGISPFSASQSMIVLGTCLTLTFALIMALLAPGDAIAAVSAVAMITAVFSVISILQAGHYALHARRAANTAFQIDVAAMIFIASMIGPLVLLLVLIRIAFLLRKVRRKTWLLT